MNTIKRGNLIVISGPSGAGKGTIVREIMKHDSNLVLSVSATTRSPRNGEINGKDYIFITKDMFKVLIESDGLLEYAEYCDNYYGTPRKAVEDFLNEGKDVILEIEIQGAEKIRQRFPEAVEIFISPPSMSELNERLKGRGTENEQVVAKRLAKAELEMNYAKNYNYIVINDTVENCSENVQSIINAERYRADRMNLIIKGVIENV